MLYNKLKNNINLTINQFKIEIVSTFF